MLFISNGNYANAQWFTTYLLGRSLLTSDYLYPTTQKIIKAKYSLTLKLEKVFIVYLSMYR
ncbi:hypothetical protein PCC6912_26570 [Chlorogloeopsis fritschii PCC 6912]|uniref:Uncharacterized protein n=1 Tax=Chlorogloeopsis fritschii PCC 6912 TaxID=211165 RepID=A0A3S0YCS7_CHLFR|nr:hypothetical protein PCC6912_26570 [Chlorogloeopsis fritschii PCC 6912]